MGEAWARAAGAGELAQLPTPGDVRASWLSFALASPTRPEEGTRTRHCIRRGLRELRAVLRVSGGVSCPSPSKALLSVQSSFLFFIVGLMCGFLPTQLSFLGSDDSPRTCPMKPCSPARQGIPPTAPSLVSREQMVWSRRAVRHCHPSRLWAEAAAVSCLSGDRFLFYLYLLLGGNMGDTVDPTISDPLGLAVAKSACPVGLPPSKSCSRAAARARAARPPCSRPHLHVGRLPCLWALGTREGGHFPLRVADEDTWESSEQNRPTDRL